MQLTKHTDYAFRILLYLLALPKNERTTINVIVERYGISKSHVMKIVNKLAASGLVNATRGKSGGLMLGKPADKIKLDEVVKLMETSLQPVNCSELNCILDRHCKLQTHLRDAANAFTASLSKVSLMDLSSNNTFTILKRD